jgi:hypothetical protein
MPEAHMAGDIEDRLKSQLIELFTMLHERNVPYVLVGGIAMLTYIEDRNTKDVDLVLSVASLSQIPEVVIKDRNKEFARGMLGDLLVDFLFTDNPLFRCIEERYVTTHRFLEMDIRCATVEGLILLKLFALPWLYRQGRWEKIVRYEADVAVLYNRYRPSIDPLFAALAPYVDDGNLAELKNIVSDIRQRLERVERLKQSEGDTDTGPPG